MFTRQFSLRGLFRKKKEFYHDRDWNNTTVNEFTEQLNAYIIRYNSKKSKSH